MNSSRAVLRRSMVALVAPLWASSLAGCGAGARSAAPAPPIAADASQCTGGATPPDIVGKYQDNFGGTHDIKHKDWVQGGEPSKKSRFEYCVVENPRSRLSAHNAAKNPFNPNLYSAFYWTRTDGGTKLWFCQQVFDAQTPEQALNAPPPDPANPSAGGCGGTNNFPWSELIPVK